MPTTSLLPVCISVVSVDSLKASKSSNLSILDTLFSQTFWMYWQVSLSHKERKLQCFVGGFQENIYPKTVKATVFSTLNVVIWPADLCAESFTVFCQTNQTFMLTFFYFLLLANVSPPLWPRLKFHKNHLIDCLENLYGDFWSRKDKAYCFWGVLRLSLQCHREADILVCKWNVSITTGWIVKDILVPITVCQVKISICPTLIWFMKNTWKTNVILISQS